MWILMNNVRGDDYSSYVSEDVFYDLDRTAAQERQFRSLQPLAPREACVVATYAPKSARRTVTFTTYELQRCDEERNPSRAGTPDGDKLYRVFIGRQLGQPTTMPKEDAAAHPDYSAFFDVLKRFKRWSVFRPAG
jgi:hypothetical protein